VSGIVSARPALDEREQLSRKPGTMVASQVVVREQLDTKERLVIKQYIIAEHLYNIKHDFPPAVL
jgi:hypothetical protein